MTDTIVHEDPAPGWGISHYHGAIRHESDHFAIVDVRRFLRPNELLMALDHEHSRGWRFVSSQTDSMWGRYIFERIND